MEPKTFISKTSVTAIESLATTVKAETSNTQYVLVKAGEDRFNEHVMFQGVNFNDVKISTQDTDGNFVYMNTWGHRKSDHRFTYTLTRTNVKHGS